MIYILYIGASQVPLVVKNPPANAGDIRDTSLIPESGNFPGGEHINPLLYSYQENPMDRGTWRATVHRITESDTTEVVYHTHMHTHILYAMVC